MADSVKLGKITIGVREASEADGGWVVVSQFFDKDGDSFYEYVRGPFCSMLVANMVACMVSDYESDRIEREKKRMMEFADG